MIRLYDFDEVRPEEILNRDIRAEADVEATVDAIIADVRARGDAALIEYAAKFDHAELNDVRVRPKLRKPLPSWKRPIPSSSRR
jgi:histidinol dehydrogenase